MGMVSSSDEGDSPDSLVSHAVAARRGWIGAGVDII